jgi:hypothetical protein
VQWFRTAVESPDFLTDNFLSDDKRKSVMTLGTNVARAVASNATKGNIWDEFSSESYKELPAVGTLTNLYNPRDPDKPIRFELPGGGRGYYRTASLTSIWATAPFLHNGSVPTIYDLLSPVSERPKTFRVGSREYDPVKLGLKLPTEGYWVFDTSRDGNHNTGHEFNTGYKPWKEGDPPARGLIGPLLSHEDRLAIIEHLKVRNDDVDGPQEPHVPAAPQCQPPPPRADAANRMVK